MNKNRIRRTAPESTSGSHLQFSIPLSNFAIDPRLAYIESVCATLIESRFGPDFIFEPFCTSPRVDGCGPTTTLARILCQNGVTLKTANRRNAVHLQHSYCYSAILVPPLLTRGLAHLGRITQAGCLRSGKFSGTQDATGGDASVNERALQFWDARSALSGTAFLGRGSP